MSELFPGFASTINSKSPFTCTLDSKKLKGRRELFLKHNDHQNQCFNFGLC